MARTVKRGTISSQTDTTNIRLDISDVIDQLSPDETPLMSLVGKDSLSTPCTQLKHEWMEDELRPRTGTLNAAYTAGSGVMTLASGQGKYLVPDDTIMIGEAVYRVLGGAPNADVLTVSCIGGTDANAASGATWDRIAHSAPEGGEARTDASKTVLNRPYNFTQIVKDWCLITGTMAVLKRYGYASERAYAEEKIVRQLMLDFEKLLLYQVRSEVITGNNRVSTCGGLYYFIWTLTIADNPSATNLVDAGGAAFTEKRLNDLLQAIWELGGMPDTCLVNGFNKRQASSWASPRIRTTRDERTAGNYITSYESDFGTIDFMKNRWLRKSDVVLVTKNLIGVGPLVDRQLTTRMLPATGDYSRSEIMGEYTIEVHKPTVAHGWIRNTSTSE